MVSFQKSISPNQGKTMPEFEISSKKRKWEEEEAEENCEKGPNTDDTKPVFDIELHLGRPLPLEWQRCLDLQSGQIHFYNTRTKKRTCRDPRQIPEQSSPSHMSLDLELTLQCESPRIQADENRKKRDANAPSQNLNKPITNFSQQMKNSGGLMRSPSWVSFEGDHQEMVAAVCMQCHMLVMLCKSSPACPNCKFMHPSDRSAPDLFKLLC